ncbi:hypothetical protein EMCRGX_G014011 [Ephydatia muelleri]
MSLTAQDALRAVEMLFEDSQWISVFGWLLACAGFLGLVLLAALMACFHCHKSQRGSQSVVWTNLFNLAKTAYEEKNYTKLRYILQTQPIDVNYTDPESGMTLLLCSCLSGNADLVRLFLERGANCRAITTLDHLTALHLATYACCTVKSANLGVLDLLACCGVSMNAVDRHGNTPLAIAALYGKSHVLNLLLQYGADPCIPNNDRVLPVNFAARSGNLETAKLLEDTMR